MDERFSRFSINPSSVDVSIAEFLLEVSSIVKYLNLLTRSFFLHKVCEAMSFVSHFMCSLPQLILVEAFDVNFVYSFLGAVVEVDLICVSKFLLHLFRVLSILQGGFLAHKLYKIRLAQLIFINVNRGRTTNQLFLLFFLTCSKFILNHAIAIEKEHPLIHLEVFNIELRHQIY